LTQEPESGAIERPHEQQRPPDQLPLPGMSRLVAWEHSGPLPPPHLLAGYEEVLPGAAERILKMAELEQRHQADADKAADERDKLLIHTQAKIALRAQWATLAIVLTLIGVVAFAVYRGQEITGAASAIAALGVIVYALNGGKYRRSHNGDTETQPAASDDGQQN
jgi:uncharacterized membrane protein